HGLAAEIRHRALPDARLIWQFWQVLHRDHAKNRIADTIDALLAGPLLPAHLDPSLIDRLPEAPGVYVLHGADRPLHVGAAENLRLHLQSYFRVDRASGRSSALSHLITNIPWRITQARLGAQLQRAMLSRTLLPAVKKRARHGFYSWRFAPDAQPAVELATLSERSGAAAESFGLFASECKARNALLRLAARNGLCHALLGIRELEGRACAACSRAARLPDCGRKAHRLKRLAQAYAALLPLRVATWPYAGPIGIRERADLHIVENWRYLGTA